MRTGEILGAGVALSGRFGNARGRHGYVAAEIARHGGAAICSVVAPYAESRRTVRRMVEDAGGTFVLVHVSTPIEECERRREEQYALARAGKLRVFTGVSDPYEEPRDAEFVLDTTALEVPDAAERLFESLAAAGLLARRRPGGS